MSGIRHFLSKRLNTIFAICYGTFKLQPFSLQVNIFSFFLFAS